jgi:polyisoprenoid-binding protein YceI
MSNHEILHAISSSNDSTIVVEVFETRLMRKYKHFLVFENFSGELRYTPEHPEKSQLTVSIDAKSIACRDQWLKANKRQRVADYIRELALQADSHPNIQLTSNQMAPKALRGYAADAALKIRGMTRTLKFNMVFSNKSAECFQIDADATFRLSDFGIKPPAALFGMIETKDQAVVHMTLLATPRSTSASA